MKTAFIVTASIAVGLMAPARSIAQTVDLADLERCAQEATSERKLACYEALTSAGARPEMARTANSDPAVAVTTSEAVNKRMIEMPPDTATVSKMTDASSESVASSTTLPSASKGPTRTDASTSADQSAALDRRGSEQLEEKADQPDVLTATVVKVAKGRFDILYFHFDNGQIWRQVQARRFHYPRDRPFDVSIATGMMGDYQLRVAGDGPMTRIKRIQ